MKIKIISLKVLFFLFVLVFSFFFFPKNIFSTPLSPLEINKIFHALKNEAVDIHIMTSISRDRFTPEEEAVIVLAKGATMRELINFNINILPKNFLLKVIGKAGQLTLSALTDPTGLIKTEIASLTTSQILDWLRRENLRIAGGKIPLSYEDINEKRQKEELYYSIIKDKEKEIVVSIYSEKKIYAPLSIPRISPINSTLWDVDNFEGEKIKPFSISFSGKIEESRFGSYFFEKRADIEIEFFDNLDDIDFPDTPLSFLERLKKSTADIAESFSQIGRSAISFFRTPWKTAEREDADSFNNDLIEEEKEVKLEEEEQKEKEKKEEEIYEKPPATKDDEKEKKIDINLASKEDLELLSGIGPVYAERIIENRPFCSLDELLSVSGIGEVTLENIKSQGLAYLSPLAKCLKEREEEKEEEYEEKGEEKINIDTSLQDEKGELSEERRRELVNQLLEIKERMKTLRKRADNLAEETKEEKEEDEEKEEKEEDEKIEEVEINSASKEDLELLTGVGPTYAKRIIENRPFCSLDELLHVSGIGEVTLENIIAQGLAYVDPPPSCDDKSEQDASDNLGGGSDSYLDINITDAETAIHLSLIKKEINATEATLQSFNEIIVNYEEEISLFSLLEKEIDATEKALQTFNEVIVSYGETIIESDLKKEEDSFFDRSFNGDKGDNDNGNGNNLTDIIIKNAETTISLVLLKKEIGSAEKDLQSFNEVIINYGETIEKIILKDDYD